MTEETLVYLKIFFIFIHRFVAVRKYYDQGNDRGTMLNVLQAVNAPQKMGKYFFIYCETSKWNNFPD